MKMMVLLMGEARSGKGSVARRLQEEHRAEVYSNASYLRDVVRDLHPDQPSWADLVGPDTKERYRGDLQDLGNFFREHWGDCLGARIARALIANPSALKLAVIDDIRFFSEVETYKRMLEPEGWTVVSWGVMRPDAERPEIGGNPDDPTERDVKRMTANDVDFLIVNDGTVAELLDKVDRVLELSALEVVA